jgi:hypothetical protein
MVDEFRSTYGKSRQWGLRDLIGHVVAFCQVGVFLSISPWTKSGLLTLFTYTRTGLFMLLSNNVFSFYPGPARLALYPAAPGGVLGRGQAVDLRRDHPRSAEVRIKNHSNLCIFMTVRMAVWVWLYVWLCVSNVFSSFPLPYIRIFHIFRVSV